MNLHTIRNFDTKRKHEQLMAMARPAVHFACLLVLLFAVVAVKAQEPAPPPIPNLKPANSLAKMPTPPTRAQKIVQQGIAIEFTVDPSAKDRTQVRAGEDVQAVPLALDRLSDLAVAAGGEPPLPASPARDSRPVGP